MTPGNNHQLHRRKASRIGRLKKLNRENDPEKSALSLLTPPFERKRRR